MKISYTLVYPLIVFVGGFLHYGIAYYDHNAGDSQKRGLLNQLLSYMSLNTIVHLFIQTTSILIRVWIGPLNEGFSTLSVVLQMICMYNSELVLLEQTINRHIKIQRWKIKSKLEVKFWIRFYAIVNNCVAMLLIFTELYLGELGWHRKPKVEARGSQNFLVTLGTMWVCLSPRTAQLTRPKLGATPPIVYYIALLL